MSMAAIPIIVGVVCLWVGFMAGMIVGDWCDAIDDRVFRSDYDDWTEESNLMGL